MLCLTLRRVLQVQRVEIEEGMASRTANGTWLRRGRLFGRGGCGRDGGEGEVEGEGVVEEAIHRCSLRRVTCDVGG